MSLLALQCQCCLVRDTSLPCVQATDKCASADHQPGAVPGKSWDLRFNMVPSKGPWHREKKVLNGYSSSLFNESWWGEEDGVETMVKCNDCFLHSNSCYSAEEIMSRTLTPVQLWLHWQEHHSSGDQGAAIASRSPSFLGICGRHFPCWASYGWWLPSPLICGVLSAECPCV